MAKPGPKPLVPAPAGIPDGLKFCPHCYSIKPVSAFSVDRWRNDDRSRLCRVCDYARQAKRRRVSRAPLTLAPSRGPLLPSSMKADALRRLSQLCPNPSNPEPLPSMRSAGTASTTHLRQAPGGNR